MQGTEEKDGQSSCGFFFFFCSLSVSPMIIKCFSPYNCKSLWLLAGTSNTVTHFEMEVETPKLNILCGFFKNFIILTWYSFDVVSRNLGFKVLTTWQENIDSGYISFWKFVTFNLDFMCTTSLIWQDYLLCLKHKLAFPQGNEMYNF